MTNNVIIPSLIIFVLLSVAIYMWTSIARDLAQIRAAQKIEIETTLRLAKLLDVDVQNDD